MKSLLLEEPQHPATMDYVDPIAWPSLLDSTPTLTSVLDAWRASLRARGLLDDE